MSIPPNSRAPYIIICSSRTDVLEAGTAAKKICAASRGAATLVAHLAEVHGEEVMSSDTLEISDLQHEMMDNLKKYTKPQAEAKCKEMFKLLYELEGKFE